jgi:hypothetical protein
MIMPEILSRYGLFLDELDEGQPQRPAQVFLSIGPRSNFVLELMGDVSS